MVAALIVVGAPLAAYVADEVSIAAVVMAIVAFVVLVYSPPARLEPLTSLAFRSLFFGLFLETAGAIWDASGFSLARAMLIAVVYGALVAAVERYVDPDD